MEKRVINGFQIIQDLIKLRWVPEILKSIQLGNHRYNHILKSIPNMSHTELNRKLTLLAKQQVISKDTQGAGTRYALSAFGKDLVHIFQHLEDLEEKYLEPRA